MAMMMDDKKRKGCTVITTAMEMFTDNGDIITKIFTHLPVKSLFRFKCVSKHWLSLISDPTFSQKHYSFHRPSPDSSISSFFLQPAPRIFDYLSPEFAPIDRPNSGVPDPSLSFLEEGFELKNSCNGLLFCQRNMGEDITYCVCNPTIMEYKLLPQLPKNKFIYCSSIVFDPSKSPHYKVVCVSRTKLKHVGIDIYSSQTGLWRASVEAFYEDRWLLNEKGVLWNGALHWTTLRKSFVSFHVERESFWTTKMPPKSSRSDSQTCRYFGESNGHLYFIETDDSCKTILPIEFDIWEMEHDYSQWCVRYHVNLDAMVKAYPEMLVPRVIYFNPDKEKYPERGPLCVSFTVLHLLLQERGEEVLWIYIPGKIIKYQIRDGTFVDYYDLPRRTYYGLHFSGYSWHDVFKFSNTLSSVQSSHSLC
ncbi:F-box protein At5g07610-like [Magnolia sinica]|uniref:F-box protein At5g07610-like n=1 Tax=Magnolia sinica TaxID=86752 RepID=UPI002658A296|nr:F-box protein At5g07610-like [Magnolia sinica]